MFSEVNATIIDGNLGKNSSTGTGVQIKIGVGTPVSENPVLITNSMKVDEIKKKLEPKKPIVLDIIPVSYTHLTLPTN